MISFRQTQHSRTAAHLAQCPDDGRPEVALSGRSNVGKSSLINRLCGQRQLARISQNPGKTRQLQYFLVDDTFYLVDVPGYGFSSSGKQARADFSQLTDQYFNSDRPLNLILHLVDIRHEPSAQDWQMIRWLAQQARPWRLLLTKADKLSRLRQNQRIKKMSSLLQEILPQAPLPLAVSAENRTGIEQLRQFIAASLGETAAPDD